MLFIAGIISPVYAGIVVTITEVDGVADNPGETATYTVNVESITTEDENLQLSVIAHEDLEMNWTFTEAFIGTGDTKTFGLEATYIGTATGNLAFTVFGEAWPTNYNYSLAIDIGLLETSSYTAYVYVTQVAADEPDDSSPSPSISPTPSISPSPTPSATPTPTPTTSTSPTPTTTPSTSPSPPPEETPTILYVAIIIGSAAAIAVIVALLRFRK